MKTIYLHGELAKRYGDEPIMLDVATPHMLAKALCHRFGVEFKQYFKETYFKFVVKEEDKEVYITDEMSAVREMDDDAEVHITPAVEGSGRFGQIILGVILIVVGVAISGFSFGTLTPLGQVFVGAGVGLVIGGIAQLLMPTPKIDDYTKADRAENQPNFVFNGGVNVYEQGGPVPLVYGRVEAGSVVISAGFNVEQIPYHNNQYPDYPDGPRRRDRHIP